MVEVAEIFRLHGPRYRAKFRSRMLPSHLRAMADIEHCRTESLGGQVYYCKNCDEDRYSYHSCKNRHCPKCQNDQAEKWLHQQNRLLLPVTYFMVTFTLPEELRSVARSNQRTVYNILFRASSEALEKLASDTRFVGGRIGMVGVLHTWTRALLYHPHVHYIATGGGLAQDGSWNSSRHDFLVPVKALSLIFQAKFRDLLKKTDLFKLVDKRVWKKAWVVHCEPVGSGEPAFKYLAPYIFRVAISNNRILKLENGRVTFKYKESATDKTRFCTLTAEEFIRRFLQHVLPSRFVKVRYYGLLSPSNRKLLEQARQLFCPTAIHVTTSAHGYTDAEKLNDAVDGLLCPKCGAVLTKAKQLVATQLASTSGRPP